MLAKLNFPQIDQKPMNYQYLLHINFQPTNYQLPFYWKLIVSGLNVDVGKILIIHGLLTSSELFGKIDRMLMWGKC